MDNVATTAIVGNFVGGKTVIANTSRFGKVYDPALGCTLRDVALTTADETRSVISVALSAFEDWSQVPPVRRARVLFRYKQLLEDNLEELARLISTEHGKVLSDARGEVRRGLEVVEFACGIPHLQKGEHSSSVGRGVDSWSLQQPLGVCVGITPFNSPVMVPLWMFPIAIATGNTFILKPSEKVPSAAIRLGELFVEAGLPPGVLNIVNGDKEVVDVLLRDDRIQAVSFVGSTPVAEYVYSEASRYGKRVQALGGAKNHCVVMQDADVDVAANALLGAAFGSAGERCMAISVAVAVGDCADSLIASLVEKMSALKIGPGLAEPENDLGPLVSQEHLERVIGFVESGIQDGAALVVDGRESANVQGESGYFLGPCLFDNVSSKMRIYQEEIFGPVLCVVRVADLEAALELVNSHEFGNGATIFTQDGKTAREFVQRVAAGMVGVNIPIPVPMAFHSFGGWKRSLFGALHIHGPDGVRFYTRMKTATCRWPSAQQNDLSFSMPVME